MHCVKFNLPPFAFSLESMFTVGEDLALKAFILNPSFMSLPFSFTRVYQKKRV